MTQQLTGEPRALARRLRELRTAHFGRPIRQKQLSEALGCSEPSISSWESSRGTALPSEERLRSYARFFATKRSIERDEPRLLLPDELKPEEHAEREMLEGELLDLRAAEPNAGSTATAGSTVPFNPWRFGPGEPIRIVCPEPPEAILAKIPYTDPNDPDYIALSRFADLDSLLELDGYLHAVNPENPIVAKLSTDMSANDYMEHVVLLGGVDWNQATRYMLEQIQRVEPTRGMPVRQEARDEDENEETEAGFVVGEQRFRAHLVPQGNKKRLIEDVAHFVRGPNPVNPNRTVTFCNGMFGRGTLGAVLALTREHYRERNARFIQNRFGDSPTYSVLSRVRILGGEVGTPDWSFPGNVLHAWPEPTAEGAGTQG